MSVMDPYDENLDEVDSSVKNKFRLHWLKLLASLDWEQYMLNECIRKLNVPGKAMCIWCNVVISYKTIGRTAVLVHVNSKKHAKRGLVARGKHKNGSKFQAEKEVDCTVKNKFNLSWLQRTGQAGKYRYQYRDCIKKVSKPGQAFCIWCEKIVRYGSGGVNHLMDHFRSKGHVRRAQFFLGLGKEVAEADPKKFVDDADLPENSSQLGPGEESLSVLTELGERQEEEEEVLTDVESEDNNEGNASKRIEKAMERWESQKVWEWVDPHSINNLRPGPEFSDQKTAKKFPCYEPDEEEGKSETETGNGYTDPHKNGNEGGVKRRDFVVESDEESNEQFTELAEATLPSDCASSDLDVKLEVDDGEEEPSGFIGDEDDAYVVEETLVKEYYKVIKCREYVVRKVDRRTGRVLWVSSKLKEEEPLVTNQRIISHSGQDDRLGTPVTTVTKKPSSAFAIVPSKIQRVDQDNTGSSKTIALTERTVHGVDRKDNAVDRNDPHDQIMVYINKDVDSGNDEGNS